MFECLLNAITVVGAGDTKINCAGLGRMGALGSVSFAQGHWGQQHPEILLGPPTLLSPLPPPSRQHSPQWVGRASQQGHPPEVSWAEDGKGGSEGANSFAKMHWLRTRPTLTFCPVSSSCRNWFQDSSVQTLSAFSLRLGTCMELGRHQLE